MTGAATAERDLPKLLTAQELADRLETVSVHRIYELTREGSIPHVRLGRAVRYSASAVAEWLEAGGTGPWSADG